MIMRCKRMMQLVMQPLSSRIEFLDLDIHLISSYFPFYCSLNFYYFLFFYVLFCLSRHIKLKKVIVAVFKNIRKIIKICLLNAFYLTKYLYFSIYIYTYMYVHMCMYMYMCIYSLYIRRNDFDLMYAGQTVLPVLP